MLCLGEKASRPIFPHNWRGSSERKFDFKNAKQQQKVNFTMSQKQENANLN